MPRLTRAESRAQTRTRLMEAGLALMSDRGFHGCTIEEICEHSEFTRGAFYANFATKAELVLAYLEEGRPLPEGTAHAVAELWLECSRDAGLWARLSTLPAASELFLVAVAALHPPLIPLAHGLTSICRDEDCGHIEAAR